MRLIRYLPEAAYLLLIFSLGFMQPQVRFRGTSLNLTEPLFLLTAGLWVIALVCRQTKFRWKNVFVLFAIYAVGLLISAVFSDDRQISFVKLAGELYLLALATLTIQIIDDESKLKRVVYVWLAASAVTAVISAIVVVLYYAGQDNWLTQFALNDYGSLPPGHYPRIHSTFVYPSLLCNYLTVSLMLLFGAVHAGWIRSSIAVTISVLFAVAILFTLTPGIGAVLLAIGLWFWFFKKEGSNGIAARAALWTGIASAVFFLLISTFTVIASPTSPFYYEIAGLRIDPTQRLLAWMDSFWTFVANPLFGKGLGLPVANVLFMPPSGKMQLLTDAHNFVLNVAAQAGLVGIIPLILICIAVVRYPLAFIRSSGINAPLNVALWIAFISAFLVQGLVGSFEDARHLWVLIGLIVAMAPKR
jgi:hypothetical protein